MTVSAEARLIQSLLARVEKKDEDVATRVEGLNVELALLRAA